MKKFTPPQSVRLTDRSTLNCTIAVLEQHFDLSADGYLCQTRDLWQVLIAVAARQSKIESTCNDLENAPDSNTFRGYINRVWMNNELIKRFDQRNIRVGMPIMFSWGALTAQMESPGQPIAVMDLLIVATALQNNLVIAARNATDFIPCGVQVINPWE
jgi:hypothetical protein